MEIMASHLRVMIDKKRAHSVGFAISLIRYTVKKVCDNKLIIPEQAEFGK
jgi:hypothetical protein